LIIFVGGAFDFHYKAMLNGVFYPYLLRNKHYQTILYAPHSARNIISTWVNHWQSTHYSIALIAHSWGCQTIMDVAHNTQQTQSIDYLITLDPVSRRFINQRRFKPDSIKQWINVFIDHQQAYFERSNLIAQLGGSWKHRRFADKNIFLSKVLTEEVTHAKAHLMFSVIEDMIHLGND
jgi:hypothetical protein